MHEFFFRKFTKSRALPPRGRDASVSSRGRGQLDSIQRMIRMIRGRGPLFAHMTTMVVIWSNLPK
jgi:hypothetical protein